MYCIVLPRTSYLTTSVNVVFNSCFLCTMEDIGPCLQVSSHLCPVDMVSTFLGPVIQLWTSFFDGFQLHILQRGLIFSAGHRPPFLQHPASTQSNHTAFFYFTVISCKVYMIVYIRIFNFCVISFTCFDHHAFKYIRYTSYCSYRGKEILGLNMIALHVLREINVVNQKHY